MNQVSFDVPRGVALAIIEVMQRYQALLQRMGHPQVDGMDLHMGLTACHANGCPMDWEKLKNADDFTLAHDVAGISRHINRRTGKLENCFLPRCHARAETEAEAA